eukprot:Pgem_evm1s20089
MYCLKALTLVATFALQCTAMLRELSSDEQVAQAEKMLRVICQAEFKKAIIGSNCDPHNLEAFNCVRTKYDKLYKVLVAYGSYQTDEQRLETEKKIEVLNGAYRKIQRATNYLQCFSGVAKEEKMLRDKCQAKFKKASSCDLYKQDALDCVRTEWRKILLNGTYKTNEQRNDLNAAYRNIQRDSKLALNSETLWKGYEENWHTTFSSRNDTLKIKEEFMEYFCKNKERPTESKPEEFCKALLNLANHFCDDAIYGDKWDRCASFIPCYERYQIPYDKLSLENKDALEYCTRYTYPY